MSWSDVGSVVGKTAPVVGALFGPLGAAIGGLVSSIFNVNNDPESVLQAVQADPRAQEKLLELQAHLIEASENADTARIQAVNTTMQAEVTSQQWFDHWRSAWGWLSAIAFFGFIAAFVYSLIFQPEIAAKLLSHATSLSELFMVPGVILGVVAWHGGKRERILSGESKNDAFSQLINMIKSVKR